MGILGIKIRALSGALIQKVKELYLALPDKKFKALLAKQMRLCQEGVKADDKQLKEAYKGMFHNKPNNG